MSVGHKFALSALAASIMLVTLDAYPMPEKLDAAAITQAETGAQQQNFSTADHGKFKELQKNFKTGSQVTEACLVCHTEAAKQVQHTQHWTWEAVDPKTGQKRGKKNIINNYGTSPLSNEKYCMACHTGYGWKDSNFDFNAQKNVDCLVCHDTTGTYRKLPGDAGYPIYKRTEFPRGSGKFVEPVDLRKVAQRIGKSSRSSCGSCHFYGAGGNGAKHGDLDSSLQYPVRSLDVHMEWKGLDFSCTTCHFTTGHQVSGSRYDVAADIRESASIRGKKEALPVACQACHGNKPHPGNMNILNQHTEKIACQTCHIPEYARDAIGTEMSRDWSQAAILRASDQVASQQDSAEHRAFVSRKGARVWDSHVVPEYRWFSGVFNYNVIGDKIDPGRTVHINEVCGSSDEPGSRIWPVKVHRGKQPYDKVNNTLIVQHLAGNDDVVSWRKKDWQKAIAVGMKAAGLPYSGEYGFVGTEMTWPITHMVAPKEDALSCGQCHSKNGRMKDIDGVYMPARDSNKLYDFAGWTLVFWSLAGVLIHGAVRIYAARNKEHEK